MKLVFCKKVVGIATGVGAMIGCSSVMGYVPTYRDDEMLDKAERIVTMWVDRQDKEYILLTQTRLEAYLKIAKEDPQTGFILYELQEILERAYADVLEDRAVSTGAQAYIKQQKAKQELLETASGATTDLNTVVISSITPVYASDSLTAPDLFSGASLTLREFYEVFMPFVTSDTPLPEKCFTYFDHIDKKAKEEDFPTALIIATRRKEHSCNFSNPANGRGNFQIISHRYEPGEITLHELLRQVDSFIAFSRHKWARYDEIQKFDTVSVSLANNSIDLTSLRKHAILYNGMYQDVTLENSTYTNNHFTVDNGGREGIVASFLKALDRMHANSKISE